jgi:hypothetical protein
MKVNFDEQFLYKAVGSQQFKMPDIQVAKDAGVVKVSLIPSELLRKERSSKSSVNLPQNLP